MFVQAIEENLGKQAEKSKKKKRSQFINVKRSFFLVHVKRRSYKIIL